MSEPNGIDLRALLRQRTEQRLRRIRKQWICLDPNVQADLDAAEAALAELVGREIQAQQLHQQAAKKYHLPTPIQNAEAAVRELRERSRRVGVMGVWQHLTADQIDEVLAVDKANLFGRARGILIAGFLRWEDADGNPIPPDVFGPDDLEQLLDAAVLERGEWQPLATDLLNGSSAPIDRPTLPA